MQTLLLLGVLLVLLGSRTLDKSVELVLGHALGLRAVHVAQGTNTDEVVDKVTQNDDVGQNNTDHLDGAGHHASGSEVQRGPNCHDEHHANGEHNPPDATALGVVLVLLEEDIRHRIDAVLLGALLSLAGALLLFREALEALALLELFAACLRRSRHDANGARCLAGGLSRCGRLARNPGNFVGLRALVRGATGTHLCVLLHACELGARDDLEGLAIALGRAIDDLGGQVRGLPRHIPVGLEPIADELLVVARLDLALLVTGSRPETAGVGREALVDQRDLAINNTKLELGVGNDDATGRGVLGSGLVDLEGKVANLRGDVLAHDLAATLERNVLVVVTDLGLRGRREQRLGKLGSHGQALRQLDAADSAVLVAGLLARTGQIAADEALARNRLGHLTRHGGAGAVGAYHEEHAHQRNKENNAAADEIHDRTVELR